MSGLQYLSYYQPNLISLVQVVGVVGVDTLLSSNPTQFLPHEITFIQVTVYTRLPLFR